MNTKDKMLNAARKLLLNKGVEATSVDDILTATKTGKSQFYHYFGNKAGMVDAVLGTLITEISLNKWCGTSLPKISNWDDLETYLQIMGGDNFHGHPLALLCLSIRPKDRVNYAKLIELNKSLSQPIISFLQSEQSAQRFLKAANVTEMGQMALTNMIGYSINKALEQNDASLTANVVAHHTTIYLKAYARV